MSKEKQKPALSRVKPVVPALRFPEFENDGEWKKVSLGKIGKPLMCKRIFKEQTSTNSENAIPFYKIGTFGDKPDAFIPIDLYNDFKSKYSFPKIGDILISASGTIGRLVVYDGADAYFQDSNIVWVANDEAQIRNSLLFYCYSNLVWQTSDGGVIKRLYNSNLKEMEICFPKNPKEQQKIANCLSSLDNLIIAETEKLAHLKDHKKGLLQQLFPVKGETKPQYRFPEFENDGDWEEITLNKISDSIFDGTHQTPKYTDNGIPFFSVENIVSGKKNKFISREDYLYETRNNKPEFGDVLLTRIGNIGFSKVIDWDYEFSIYVTLAAIKKSDLFISKYLNGYFQSSRYQQEIRSKSLLNAAPIKINMDELRRTKILLPPTKKEQQKIANCLSSVDDLIEAQTQKIEALKAHKKGLMQQLFPNSNELAV